MSANRARRAVNIGNNKLPCCGCKLRKKLIISLIESCAICDVNKSITKGCIGTKRLKC